MIFSVWHFNFPRKIFLKRFCFVFPLPSIPLSTRRKPFPAEQPHYVRTNRKSLSGLIMEELERLHLCRTPIFIGLRVVLHIFSMRKVNSSSNISKMSGSISFFWPQRKQLWLLPFYLFKTSSPWQTLHYNLKDTRMAGVFSLSVCAKKNLNFFCQASVYLFATNVLVLCVFANSFQCTPCISAFLAQNTLNCFFLPQKITLLPKAF